MAQKLYEESNIQAIANAIRIKNSATTTYKPSEMAAAIINLPSGGGGGGTYILTGDCSGKFYCGPVSTTNINGIGDFVFIDLKDYINFSSYDITNASSMFANNPKITEIPFDLNFADGDNKVTSLFNNCNNLKTVPKINNCRPSWDMDRMFYNCYSLEAIPQDFVNWFVWKYCASFEQIFYHCRSLKQIPVEIFEQEDIAYTSNDSKNRYPGAFYSCYNLTSIENLCPMRSSGGVKIYNNYENTFHYCARLKKLTFKYHQDGGNCANQIIDLSVGVGYASTTSIIKWFGKNAEALGLVLVNDDTSYQANKSNDNWYTTEVSYSRYNKTSAIETINSLPDTSAYLATAGGTNTIKFLGSAGELTDGGAINTLTEEQIAVATAKGWTVSLV